MGTVRDHSIAAYARRVIVPPLTAPAMITAGGAHSHERSAGCHSQPGVEESELASALYPQPPHLATVKHRTPDETFWIIKHGMKMSVCPRGVPHMMTRASGRWWRFYSNCHDSPRCNTKF